MSAADWIIASALLAAVTAAVIVIIIRRKKGKRCSCDCENCQFHCENRKK